MIELARATLLILVAACASPDIRTHSVTVWLPDSKGANSGTMLRGGEMVLTARHVVAGIERVGIEPYGDGGGGPATVTQVSATVDAALVQVETPLRTGAMVDCRQPQVGERLIVVGNPSPLRWAAIPAVVVATEDTEVPGAIVVSMPVSSGLSGGGALDARGRLVGVLIGGHVSRYGYTGFGIIVPMDAICAAFGWRDEPWVLRA